MFLKNGGTPVRRHTKYCIELSVQTSLWSFWLRILLNQQTKKGIITIGWVIYPDYVAGIELPLHEGSKKDYVWNAANPLACLNLTLYLVIKINGK